MTKNAKNISEAKPNQTSAGLLETLLGYHIARVDYELRKLYETHVGARLGLRTSEYSVLMIIAANSDITARKVGDMLAIAAPNLSTLVERLRARGLIKRTQSETDKRAVNLSLTVDGKRVVKEANALSANLKHHEVPRLSASERQTLLALLQKVY